MATIIERKNKFNVVYYYENERGVKQQKWETFDTKAEAKKRKVEVEHQMQNGTFVAPTAKTVADLLAEYVGVYGVNRWAMSTYDGNVSLINNYILPIIGSVKLDDLSTRMIDKYYLSLLKVRTRPSPYQTQTERYLGPYHVKRIHRVLRSAFNQGVRWELLAKNPCLNATLPKVDKHEREIWDAETFLRVVELCDDDLLRLALNLALAGSLRMGEMLGLTWDSLDITEESIANSESYIYINKELQRVSKTALEAVGDRGVIRLFPAKLNSPNSRLVLKEPKTKSSVRHVYLPKSVAEMLVERKKHLDEMKELLGNDFYDYNLVFCADNGMPLEGSAINRLFTKLIKDNNLPRVVFHSLRHTSTTYKLKLTHGDIKAVQGDTGHSQTSMVTDRYAHIIDADRKVIAEKMEATFFSGSKTKESEGKQAAQSEVSSEDRELIMQLMSNPQAMTLLKSLAKAF